MSWRQLVVLSPLTTQLNIVPISDNGHLFKSPVRSTDALPWWGLTFSREYSLTPNHFLVFRLLFKELPILSSHPNRLNHQRHFPMAIQNKWCRFNLRRDTTLIQPIVTGSDKEDSGNFFSIWLHTLSFFSSSFLSCHTLCFFSSSSSFFDLSSFFFFSDTVYYIVLGVAICTICA